MIKIKKLFFSFLPTLITFVAYLILFFGGLEINIEFWSVIFHFLGGFAVSWTVWLLAKNFSSEIEIFISPAFIFVLFIISMTSVVGILWEFWEWSVDFYFGVNFLGDVNDTLFDLFMDIIGSITIVVYPYITDKLTILTK